MLQDRTQPIQTYVSEDEKEQIQQTAKKAQVAVSDFVRHAIAFYMERGLEVEPINPKSHKGGARPGAGRPRKRHTA